ncbi:MAG: hypothetical protein DHS20C16_12930 [Phycisphaerae bacterium]|nr:MAG: hypothetical protein DHS20C16_12930 [Phycisphaerae bacterium]
MLQRRKRVFGVMATALVAMILLAAAPAKATVVVSLSPANQSVDIGDGTASVDIIAVIPQADAVVGWGLDLDLFGSSVSIGGASVNEPTWTAVSGTDLDGLAGLVPFSPGTAIWSDPVAIVLATVTLSLDSLGTTNLTLSDDNPADLSEGFALDPPPVGEFADVTYEPGSITVTPEPASLVFLLLGGMACVSRRR